MDMVFKNRVYDMSLYYGFGLVSTFSNAVLNKGASFPAQYASASKSFDRIVENLLRKIPD